MSNNQSTKDFNIKRIVLKDLSFEAPMGQVVFTKDWQPDYDVRLDLRYARLADKLWEVILTATVTAKLENSIAFLIEAQKAGVFKVADLEPESLRRVLTLDAPSLIFPYLRETVDNVAVKGGFPPVGIQPPDFEASYENADPAETSSGGET